MAPHESWATTGATRRAMRANKSRDTAPELAVRRALFARGFRYRVNRQPLPGYRRTADIVFPRKRVAVFIDGCFWHGCPEHHRLPTSNREYWAAKVERNIARDIDTNQTLIAAGWRVLRFWEHQDAEYIAGEVHRLLTSD